jgi:hypothetical protein
LNFLYTRSEDALSTDRRRLMRRTRKVLAPLVSVLVTLGIAVTVHADVMQATGHLQGKKGTACVGPFFIDGLNGGGGFMVTGKTSPGAGEWTVVRVST